MQELATVTFQAYGSFIFFSLFISLATKPKVIKSLGALLFDNTPPSTNEESRNAVYCGDTALNE